MMHKLPYLGLILLLSIIGVIGDYFLKKAGEDGKTDSRYISAGILFFAVTAIGWFLVYRVIKMSSAGFLYGICTALLLAAVGIYFFKENINFSEKIGIALALISILLLSRFA